MQQVTVDGARWQQDSEGTWLCWGCMKAANAAEKNHE